MLIASVSAGSAYITIVSGSPEIAKWLALVVAIITIMDVILKWPEKARQHDELCRSFHELAQEINQEVAQNSSEDAELAKKKLAKFENQILDIQADEPTVLEVLNVICHNVQAQAQGHSEKEMFQIRWWQALFSNICDLPPNDFKNKSTA